MKSFEKSFKSGPTLLLIAALGTACTQDRELYNADSHALPTFTGDDCSDLLRSIDDLGDVMRLPQIENTGRCVNVYKIGTLQTIATLATGEVAQIICEDSTENTLKVAMDGEAGVLQYVEDIEISYPDPEVKSTVPPECMTPLPGPLVDT